MQVMLKADKNNTTLESEVQIQVDVIQARKKHHGDHGAQGQSSSDLGGNHPGSPVDPGTQPDPLQEALAKIQFPIASDPISPLTITDYTSFATRAPSSLFQPLFPPIPTRPRGA